MDTNKNFERPLTQMKRAPARVQVMSGDFGGVWVDGSLTLTVGRRGSVLTAFVGDTEFTVSERQAEEITRRGDGVLLVDLCA